MENSKPFLNRVTACLCAILICSCLVIFAFMIPPTTVKADSIADQYEDWLDDKFGEGTAFVVDELMEAGATGVGGTVGKAVYLGVAYAANVMESHYFDGNSVPINSLSIVEGYYWYNATRHLCCSAVSSSSTGFTPADSFELARSDQFTIHATIVPVNGTMAYYQVGVTGFVGGQVGPELVGYRSSSLEYSCGVEGGGSIFPSLSYTTTKSYGSYNYAELGCMYVANKNDVVLTDNMTTADYFGTPYNGRPPIAGGFNYDNTYIQGSNLYDAGLTEPIDLTDPSGWVINYLNEWIIEEYPDIDVDFLFTPAEDTTDTTGSSGGGCNCNHNIYVDVTCYYDPEINVYVTEYITVENNVEVELPSDWVQDYTLTTDPYEFDTIPIPTADNSEPVTMPTVDVSEYEEAYGNAIDFWFYVAQSFIEKMHLQLIIAFAFALSVVGFCLWKLGGGGKE